MPRAPTYQPGQIAPAETTGARLRAADNDGGVFGALGKGLQVAGKATQDYVTAEDARQALSDETYARTWAVEYKGQADPLKNQFGTLLGKNAVDAAGTTQDQLKTLYSQTLGKAANARQRRMLEQLISPASTEYQGAIGNHVAKQQLVMTRDTTLSEIETAKNSAAAAFNEPAKLQQFRGEAVAANKRLALLEGWDEPKLAAENFKVGSGIHAAVIQQSILSEDIDMASTYYQAHEDEMTLESRLDAMQALKGPLEERDSAAKFAEEASGLGGLDPSVASRVPRQTVAMSFGTYQMPVQGAVKNTYSQHRARGSHGLDIGAPLGSAVRPIADGVVTAVSSDARAGKFIIVKHPDGTTSSYSHLGDQSVRVGDPVSATTAIGTIGMTGRTTGPHLHLRTKNAQGADVDPQSVLGGKALSGTVIGSPGAARNYDQAAILARIAKRTDWSFEVRERVSQYARRHMAQSEAALADQYQDADEQAARVIAELPNGLTNLTQVPKGIRDRMSPRTVAELGNGIRTRARAASKEAQETAWTKRWLELEILKRNHPEQFVKTPLIGEVGKLSPSQLRGFMLDQATEAGKLAKPEPYNPREGIKSAIAWGKTYGGADIDNKDFPQVYDAMDAYLRNAYSKSGKLESTDYDAAFKSATRSIRVTSSFLGIPVHRADGPAYAISAVPDEFRSQFDRNWKGRAPPTDDDRQKAYRAFVARGGH